MTAQRPAQERDDATSESPDAGPSDLIGLRLTLYLVAAMLAVLAAFFFIGPVVGIIVLLGAVLLGILGVAAAVRRAEVGSD